MTTTPKLGLPQWVGSDTVTRASFNSAWSQVDTAAASQSDLNTRTSDIFGSTSVVLSGGVATKDATVATQLDVTAANVYFGTGEHVNFSASSAGNFTTSTINATYYLDYNSDGTTSWGTAHSTKTGYVPIAQVTTDSAGNILTVTDERPTLLKLFYSAIGLFGLRNGAGFVSDGGAKLSTGSQGQTWASLAGGPTADAFQAQDNAGNIVFQIDNGGVAGNSYNALVNGKYLAQILSGGYKKTNGSSSASVATAGTAVTVTYNFPTAYSSAPTITGIAITSASVGTAGYVNVLATSISATSVTFTVNSYVAQTIGFSFEVSGS